MSPARIALVLLLLVSLAGCQKRLNTQDAGLMAAARTGHAGTVKDMIAAGANLNARDEHGNTPLLEAARNGHDDVVRALLAAGADATIKNDDGNTALALALQNSHEDAARALREAGVRQ